MIDRYNVNCPNYFSRGLQAVARFERDAHAFMRGPLPSRDPEKVSGILIPPDSFIRNKESGHREYTELGPSRKRPKAASVAIKSTYIEWD